MVCLPVGLSVCLQSLSPILSVGAFLSKLVRPAVNSVSLPDSQFGSLGVCQSVILSCLSVYLFFNFLDSQSLSLSVAQFVFQSVCHLFSQRVIQFVCLSTWQYVDVFCLLVKADPQLNSQTPIVCQCSISPAEIQFVKQIS